MASSSLYEIAFNNSPIGEYFLSPESDPVILAVNDTFLRTVGRKRDDLVNVRLFDAFPENPDDPADTGLAALRNSLSRVIETGKLDAMPTQRYPIWVTTATGEQCYEERFWNASNTPIFDEHGKLACILHRTSDITDQVNAQKAAQESEHQAKESAQRAEAERWRLDAVLEMAPVGIGICDLQGKLILVNSENRRVWGLHPMSENVDQYAEWKGWWADGSPRHGQAITPQEWGLARALQGEVTPGDIVEIEPFGLPGTRKTVLLRAAPVRDTTGAITGAVVVQMDITEQVKATAALRESEAQFRTIADAVPQMVWSTNSEGQNDYNNRQWQAYTGITVDKMYGNGWSQVIHPDDLECLWEIWRHSLATGQEYEVEHRIKHYSGVYRWVLNRALPVRDDKGEIVRWMGTITDIHEQKSLQHTLQEADRRKDEFLAMLAHELRNPLAPIAAAADLLQLIKLDEEKVRQTSTIIARQIRHMTGLVDDLLDISRVTRGIVKLDKGRLDAKRIIFDAVEQVMPLIESRGHRLAVHTPPATAFVLGDQKRLVQVLANLLNNAAKYTPEGGDITLTMEVDGAHVKTTVADNGIGMEPELVSRAFELFSQAERTADRSQGGLGIGLALVKGLVELHGGTVTAHSQGLGKGSRFTVCLPHLMEQSFLAEKARTSELDETPSRRLKVMIVDDNADAAHMLGMFVEALGHEVLIEHRSIKALERAKMELPDVYLLDIGLPEMDGHELARRLQAQPETALATLIAITGYGQEQDRQDALNAGFRHHFAKPVDTVKLSSVLDQLAVSPVESAVDSGHSRIF